MTEKIYSFTKKQLNVEKNKVLSRFASVASHDLKNVVGGLSNIAYYLSKTVKTDNENQKKMLALLSSEVVTLNKAISDILDMTRVKQLMKSPCDLNSLISKAIEENTIDTINFETNLISAKIYADPERMKQVFSNIIINAKDAMKNSGTIKISMKIENGKVITEITDFGSGMDEETLENCFDPMFSTKLAKSVGMGLTVALQIVEMHNGTISVSSQLQKGTTFVVSLPLIKEE